ncbi:MAG TPA: hypothetical protein VG742_12995 [Dongiaceae bacterium]|nr:hypothetical protein [Dongiaceae bacterium]
MLVLRVGAGAPGEQIDAVRVDAPPVAATHGEALPIEELKDLDGDLAAVVEPVAERSRVEAAIFRMDGDITGDLCHLRDRIDQEEMVQRHLIDFAAPRRQAEHAPHDLFIDAECVGDVAHARRPETVAAAQERPDAAPDLLFVRAHAHFVIGPPQPGAIDEQRALLHQTLDGGGKQRRRQARLQRQAQLLLRHALHVRPVRVELVQRRHRAVGKMPPRGAAQGDGLAAARQRHQIKRRRRCDDRALRGGAVAEKGLQIDKAARPVQGAGKSRVHVPGIQRQQLGAPDRRPPLALRRAEIEQHAAADGAAGGGVADDETIARRHRDRPIEDELDKIRLAWRDRLVAQHHDAGRHVRRAVMQPHRHPLANRLPLAGQHAEPRIHPAGRCVQGRIQHDIAALYRLLGDVGPCQRQGAALSRAPFLCRAILHMQRADARGQARRADHHAIADADPAGKDGAGDDRSGPGQGEAAVDRQAEAAVRHTRGPGVAQRIQPRGQHVDPFAGQRRDRQYLRARQAGRRQRRRDRVAHLAPAFGIDEIHLGQGDDAARQVEQIEDRQMFAGLGHDAVIRGNHQQHAIDAGGAGQHVVHQLLVARHIDETDDLSVRARPIGEAEVQRDAARLFFRQPIRVNAGQGAHQGGLAMVDMAGGADDHAAPAPASGAAARRSASRR